MTTPTKLVHGGAAVIAALVLIALTAGAGLSAPLPGTFIRLASVNGGTTPQFAFTRTAKGDLHLIWQTMPSLGSGWGLATLSIAPGGFSAGQVQALAGWQAGIPGLITLPNGSLEAVFGAISPQNVDSVWGINSTDGGQTWSAPADVKGGGPTESLAYGSDLTAVLAGQMPVLTLPQAGNLVVQQGLGAGMPSAQVNGTADGSLGGVNSAVDAAANEAYASWESLNGQLHDVIQPVAPSVGSPQVIPGQVRPSVPIAGRDVGAGIFAAYTPDNTHVRLLRYGGGSAAVGSVAGVTAKVLGVATGPQGRIWVMWGDESGIAATRSNMAGTAFEPIQHFKLNAASIWRLTGDGRIGPLDLVIAQTPATGPLVPGLYWGQVRPELTGYVTTSPIKNKKGTKIAATVTVHVTDAGDPVPGALVQVAAKTAKTNSKGIAAIVMPGATGSAAVTAALGSYLPIHLKATW